MAALPPAPRAAGVTPAAVMGPAVPPLRPLTDAAGRPACGNLVFKGAPAVMCDPE